MSSYALRFTSLLICMCVPVLGCGDSESGGNDCRSGDPCNAGFTCVESSSTSWECQPTTGLPTLDSGRPTADTGLERPDSGVTNTDSSMPPGDSGSGYRYPDRRCDSSRQCPGGGDFRESGAGLFDACICRTHASQPANRRCTTGLRRYNGPDGWGYCGRYYCHTTADCADLGPEYSCNDLIADSAGNTEFERLGGLNPAPGSNCNVACGGCGWCGPRTELTATCDGEILCIDGNIRECR